MFAYFAVFEMILLHRKLIEWQNSREAYKKLKLLKSITYLANYKVSIKDSSRSQILHLNRPSNHPSTTRTRPEVKQACLPTKTAVVLGPSY